MGKSRCNLCAKVGGGRMQTLYLRARLLRRRCGMLCGNRKKKSGRKDTPPRVGESWEAQEAKEENQF